MEELDGWDIPDLSPTVDGTCVSDPANVANASARGWWTCGGYTRDTDITVCPGKPMTWGTRYGQIHFHQSFGLYFIVLTMVLPSTVSH